MNPQPGSSWQGTTTSILAAEWHGKEVLRLQLATGATYREGEKAVKGLRALGKPIVDVISPHPFVGWQTAFDPLLTPGARNYWKSHDSRTSRTQR